MELLSTEEKSVPLLTNYTKETTEKDPLVTNDNNQEKKTIRSNLIGALFISLQSILYAACSLYQRYAFEYRPELTFAKTNIFMGVAVMAVSYIFMKKTNSCFTYDSYTNKILFFRVLTSMGSDSLVFLAGKYARLGTVSCIMHMYPIFTCIIEGLVLKTHTSLLDYLMLVGCLFGSFLIVKPFSSNGGEDTNLGLIISTIALAIMCSTLILNRLIEHSTSIHTMNFYCGVAFFLLGIAMTIINQESLYMVPVGIILLSLVGIGYSISRVLFNLGVTLGDYSYILPFDNLTLLFSVLFGCLILHDKFDTFDLMGTVIIGMICLYKSMY